MIRFLIKPIMKSKKSKTKVTVYPKGQRAVLMQDGTKVVNKPAKKKVK